MDQCDDKRPDETATGKDNAADADFRALAEDWIAIWQSEITAYLNDPETQAQWSAMVALWGEAAQAMMRAVPPAPGFAPAHDRKHPSEHSAAQPARADAAARAAPAADASEPRDDEVRRLEQRVAELERRLGSRDGDAGRPDASRSRGPADANRSPRRGGRARG
ncbi:hypothetical protein [Acidisoma cellulosilyticum]|uniref:hypothetical protein n=1 Tax=Acidisoma cellulosilyticum TaxID=2802395 RepID=UPI001D0B3100|nr:hypothetical protein [Acidisoma cellulosilyticum]